MTQRVPLSTRTRRIAATAAIVTVAMMAATLAACGNSTGTRSVSLTHAYAYGTVTNADGSPAAGINVRVQAYLTSSCPPGPTDVPVVAPLFETTDAAGHFRRELAAGHAPFTGCVQADVLAPGSQTQFVATARGTVSFAEPNDAAAYDSVRLDARLP